MEINLKTGKLTAQYDLLSVFASDFDEGGELDHGKVMNCTLSRRTSPGFAVNSVQMPFALEAAVRRNYLLSVFMSEFDHEGELDGVNVMN